MNNNFITSIEASKENTAAAVVSNEYLSLDEIQDFLGIKYDKALELVKNAYFPSIKLSKAVYIIPRTAFMRFITDPDKIIAFKQKSCDCKEG